MGSIKISFLIVQRAEIDLFLIIVQHLKHNGSISTFLNNVKNFLQELVELGNYKTKATNNFLLNF